MKHFSVVSLLLTIFSAGCTSQSEDLHMISSEVLSKELNDTSIVILDVRTPDEYQTGHLPHAQLIDYYSSDFREQVHQLDHKKTYVLYCASGGRSAKASKIMMQDGFQHISDLTGGYNHWNGKVEK